MIRTQEQTFSGEVSQYLYNPEGEIDGLLLNDGTQIHFPPHLGVEVAEVIQPSNPVVIQGVREGANLVMAFAITNQSTGQSVVDNGPPLPRMRHAMPPRPPAHPPHLHAPLPPLPPHLRARAL
jgi:hypothetical protein